MRSAALTLAASVVAAWPAVAGAASITWANVGTDFATPANWSGGVAPVNSGATDIGVFTSLTSATVPNLAVNRSVNGLDFQLASGYSTTNAAITSAAGVTLSIGSSGLGASTQISGTTLIGVAAIRLLGTQTWNVFSSTSTTATSVFTVNSAIDLNVQTFKVSANRANVAGNVGVVNLAGSISGSPNGTYGLSLVGATAATFIDASSGAATNIDTINLTGANTYVGTTNIAQVNVTANSLANDGTASALGQSGDVLLGSNGGSSSSSTATLTFQNLSANGATDRHLIVSGKATGGYTLNNNSAYSVAFNNAGTTIANSTAKFQLGGTSTAANVFGQVLNDYPAAAPLAVSKAGVGNWALTASNTYTGGTAVTAGTLRANNATSSLGGGATTVTGTGVLAGTGATGGTVTVGNAAGSGGTITAGTGAGAADTVGTLASGNQTWNSDGRFVAKFASAAGASASASGNGSSGVNWDRLSMGTLSINSGFGLVLTKALGGGYTTTAAGYYRIATTGTITVATGIATVAAGRVTPDENLTGLFNLNTSDLGIDASHFQVQAGDDASGLFVSYDGGVNAAPEPTTAALVGLSGLGLLGRRRRR